MHEALFLTWVRGPGLNIAISVFLLGTIWRLIEIYSLGRKQDIAPARERPGATGLHTIFRRSLPAPGIMQRSPISYIGGYIFHLGLAVIVFLFEPHIKLISSLIGLSWPALPSPVIDGTAIITMAAMLVMLFDRINQPVKRFLSTFEDYLTWTLTFLPVLTGYLALKHLLLPYTTMLAVHILSVELLLIIMPFSKLFHAISVFGSRWYNGSINGRRGVPV